MELMFSKTRDLRFSLQPDGAGGNGALANLTVSRSAKEILKDLISDGLKPGNYLSSEYGFPKVRALPPGAGLATNQEELPFSKMRNLSEGTEGLLRLGLLDDQQVQTLRGIAADEPVRFQLILEAFAELATTISNREATITAAQEVAAKGTAGNDLDPALVFASKEALFRPGDDTAFEKLKKTTEMIVFCHSLFAAESTQRVLQADGIEALRNLPIELRYKSAQEISLDMARVDSMRDEVRWSKGWDQFKQEALTKINTLAARNVDLAKLLEGLPTLSKGLATALNRFNPELLRRSLSLNELREVSELSAGLSRISKGVARLPKGHTVDRQAED